VRPQIRGCDLTTATAFAPIRPLQNFDHGSVLCLDQGSDSM
jgi:hypothetical protein